MNALEILLSAKETPFKDETGKKGHITLYEPYLNKDIESLSRRLRAPLPLELERLLRCAHGFDSALGPILLHFDDFILEDLFPHGLPIGWDGCWNLWMLDIKGDSADDAAVFFACHDPPVIALQANSIGAFIADVIAYGRKESNTAIEKVTKQSVDMIWRDEPGLLTYEQCLQSDASLKKFAESLSNDFEFVDLRNAQIGDGFAEGKYGADTICKRYGTERIFARQKKELNWFQKIFGV